MRQVLLLIILLSPILCFGQEIENDIDVRSYVSPDSVRKYPANFNVSDSVSSVSGNIRSQAEQRNRR
ncbi:MAG: hypothetical protein K2L45_06210 [Muribaculaceae bacterium]|nr:hypothetical protein [Muribaculaceae bacterium]